MSPRLVATSGPLRGAILPLEEGDTAIGRDPERNRLPIADPSLSPCHCVVGCREGAVTIRSLDANNPSFVNGLPARDRGLSEGDEIQIGESTFLLRLAAADEPPGTSASVAEGGPAMSGMLVMHREEVIADHVGRDGASVSRLASDLSALIRTTAAINAVRGLVGLGRPLLELIADVVPASRGALVAAGANPSAEPSAVVWSRPGDVRTVSFPRVLADRVLGEGVGLLTSEPTLDNGPHVSVLAAPLVAFNRVIGAIVLESDAGVGRFDAGHLRLVMAIAGVAATALEHERHLESLEEMNRQLKAEIDADHNMVGDSKAMRDVYRRIARVAPADSTVLITGESGTGKELAARAIHRNSARSEKPFVAINCAAITETLLESELFGHEKGAFTGAITQKKGKLETAEGGTVFLDEIGELSPPLQAKLLRVLQDREFERVGGVKSIRVDFRLVAATNRDLEAAIQGGTFRRDLYYRLKVVELTMPALRDRRDDIPLLAACFLRRHRTKARRPLSGFAVETLACLDSYDWPGNVRELENAVEHAIVLGVEGTVLPEDLPEAVAESRPSSPTGAGRASAGFHAAVKQAKRELIVRAFEQAEGNYNRAARLLGLNPTYLHRLIKNLQLKGELDDS